MNNDEIIKNSHYPAYVVASAGTGKTELIARKVEHLLIEENVDIDKIALITFTNKATAETIERIKGKLYQAWLNGNKSLRKQIDKINLAKISTIHVFCDNIVREFAMEVGLCPNYAISNLTLEKEKIANDIIKDNYDEKIFETIPMFRATKMLVEIEEKASDKGIDIIIDDCPKNTFWDSLRAYFGKIYPIYAERLEQCKLELGKITLNDLIKYAVKLLRNKQIAPYIKNSLEYVFLDEAQDINYLQAELMELLIDYGIKVFVVGDEKQSIYAFRGSDKKAFNQLINYINDNGGTKFELTTNYRSDKFIIDKVNNLFSRQFRYKLQNLNFNNQELVAADNATYTDKAIEIKFAGELAEIVENVAVNLESEKSPCYNKIAILCRTNREVLRTYQELLNYDIPAQIYISKSIYQSKAIIDLCKLLNCISGGGVLEKAELFYTDLYLSANANGITEKQFNEIVDNSTITFKENGIISALHENFENCNLLNYYLKTDNKQALANIQRFVEILRDLIDDNMTDMEIINYLNVMIATGKDENQPQVDIGNAVIVSTIHTFKGLASDVVIINEIDSNLIKGQYADFYYDTQNGLSFNKNTLIPNLNIENDSRFESMKNKIIIDNLEEELNIMYVMMTRAKKKLILRSRKELDKVKFHISQTENYASYLRWIYKI